MGAMANPWDCICEFIRSQSANLQNVMDGLSNQNSFSDLDTSDTLTLNSGMSPLHLFMFMLLAVWGFLYVSGRQRDVGFVKSFSSPGDTGHDGPSDGSGSASSSGSGQGSGDLF